MQAGAVGGANTKSMLVKLAISKPFRASSFQARFDNILLEDAVAIAKAEPSGASFRLSSVAVVFYFITLSVKIAIDFTPPERLKSMASIAAA